MFGKPLAYVVKIDNIAPIAGADRIELAKVMDYTVVVKKNEYKTGDLAIYVEIDSILPDGLTDELRDKYNCIKNGEELANATEDEVKTALKSIQDKSKYPAFEFLRDKNFKIKSMKLSKFGVISQGILFKPTDLGITEYKKGQDFTLQLNITTLIEDEEEAGVAVTPKSWLTKKLMRFGWFRNYMKKNHTVKESWNPTWPSKSDEENVQKVFTEMKEKYGNCEWVATEKLEGQNITIFTKEVRKLFGGKKKTVGVCSRTRELNPDGNNKAFWSTVIREGLDKKIAAIPGEWFCRGEHIGPGIQKNWYKLPRTTVRFFDFYEKVDGKYRKLNFEESIAFSKKYDLPFVPVLDEHYKLPETAQEMLKQSDKKTVFGNNLAHKREGFVLRLRDDYNVSFKVKNPFYEL